MKEGILTWLLITFIIPRVVQGSPKISEDLAAVRHAKAKEIRQYINETADPCENFFDFACGNWKTYFPASASVTRRYAFLMSFKEFDQKLIPLLTTSDANDTAWELKVKHFYESCLKVGSLKLMDYRKKLQEIAEEFGQMPALVGDKWRQQDFDWLKAVGEIAHKYGITIIVGFAIRPNEYDHTANALLLVSQEFQEREESEVVSILKKFLDLDDKRAEELAKEIFEFEASLMKANGNASDIKKPEKISLEDMYHKYLPHFDAKKLLNISYGCLPTGEIFDKCPYVQSLVEVINNNSRKVVANYVFFQLLLEFVSNIPETETDDKCISQIEEEFPDIVTNIFYRWYDLKDEEQELTDIWLNIKSKLHSIFESSRLEWFDDETREFNLEKLHVMNMVVPSFQENNFATVYGPLAVNKQDYLENLKSLKSFKTAKARASLYETSEHVNQAIAISSPIYAEFGNIIILSVSVLKNDFFWSPAYPKALNYGRLGVIMGHEAIHGFSAEGRYYSKVGERFEGWPEEIEQKYAERRQCLYDQYQAYTQLPQEESQAENAADNAGIILAFESYRQWYKDPRRSQLELELETLPNLNYTKEQLFFIYHSQFWCSDVYTKSDAATSDGHSPAALRAFVPLTNFEEFSKAFNCPTGSPMNPVKKCKIY